MNKNSPQARLAEVPLWRLLVALADAERAFGPGDKTTRDLALAVQERLAADDADCPKERRGN